MCEADVCATKPPARTVNGPSDQMTKFRNHMQLIKVLPLETGVYVQPAGNKGVPSSRRYLCLSLGCNTQETLQRNKHEQRQNRES
jgi:hypothetical protein